MRNGFPGRARYMSPLHNDSSNLALLTPTITSSASYTAHAVHVSYRPLQARMQRIKDAIVGNSHEEHSTHSSMSGHSHQHHGDVVSERPVAVGVAEVPVVVTEQQRHSTNSTHSHREHHHVHEEVCGQKTFTEVEDRPIVKERVERIMEHRPVEKQYVVETRFVGEREMGVSHTEIVDVKERVVEVAQPGPTCPANTGAVMNEVVNSITGTTHRI